MCSSAGFLIDVSVQTDLSCSMQVMHPSLDDIQQALNKAAQHVLEVSRGIAQLGQERFQMVAPGAERAESTHHQGSSRHRWMPPQQLQNDDSSKWQGEMSTVMRGL